PNAQLVGVHRQGSYAEFVSVPAKVVRRIPPSIGYEEEAALALSRPVAVTPLQIAGLRKGDWVVVTAAASGLGLVTSLVAQALGARGTACSRKEWKREILRGHGFEAVLNTDDDGFVDQVKELTAGLGFAMPIDTPAPTSMFVNLCALLDRLV